MDICYQKMLKILPEVDLSAAGYFEDNLNNSDLKVNWQYTPTYNLNVKKNKVNTVLVSTGCFAPLHHGHLAMMDKAKKVLKKTKNHHFAGGYFALAHDDYIKQKIPNNYQQYDAECRLATNKLFLEQNNHWAMIDPWIAFACKNDVNFTNYILRLKYFLTKKYKAKFNIVFVCGSDNYQFMNAFVGCGFCICVVREKDQIKKAKALSKSLNKIRNCSLILSDNINQRSSTEIRKSYSNLDKSNKIKKQLFHYLIRVEPNNHSNALILKNALQKTFKSSIKIILMSVDEQKTILKKYLKKKNLKSISLDNFIPGDYNLSVSRVFLAGAGQINHHQIIINNFPNQVSPGSYILFDDDIITGSTIKLASKLLSNKKVKIIESVSLLNLWWKEKYPNQKLNLYDVVDCRDFFANANQNSGLLLNNHNKSYRAPYTDLDVNLSSRAKIPPEKISLFKKVLKIKSD